MKPTLYERGGKRALDLLAGATLAVLTAPAQAICGLVVALTAGRPVLYSQERTGRGGKAFKLFKFRTMVAGAHELSGGYPTPAMITPAGGVMRKFSLDELPQVWNLMRGEVSLVGPRPALPDQVQRYSERQVLRLAARPGITGLAQVRYRNNAPWSLRIEADLEYLESVSMMNDFRILLRTVPAVLFGVGVATGQSAAEVDDLGGEPGR